MIYVWIVVQTKELAYELNARLPLPDGTTKIEAVFYGQALCGRNYRGMRPNIVVSKYEDNDERLRSMRWVDVVLRPGTDRNAIWI